ncbi:MAG TPA: MarR family transcriptional regulator, partial [Actinomycetes bacterium]|nr:MarR family transcriptional regulator [Actinomycetes bacterium]
MRLFQLTVRLGEEMEKGLVERGLTRARAAVIWQLHQQGPVTQRTLSQALRVSPRNITGLLDALEAGGYVARGRHPTDRRATLVSLTDEGAA